MEPNNEVLNEKDTLAILDPILEMTTGLIVISSENKEARTNFITALIDIMGKRPTHNTIKEIFSVADIGNIGNNGTIINTGNKGSKPQFYVQPPQAPWAVGQDECLDISQNDVIEWEDWMSETTQEILSIEPDIVVFYDLPSYLMVTAVGLGMGRVSFLSVDADSQASANAHIVGTIEAYGYAGQDTLDLIPTVFMHTH